MTGILESPKKKDLKRVEMLLRQYDCSNPDELLRRLCSDRNHLESAIARLERLNRLRAGEAAIPRLVNRRIAR